MIGSRRGSQTGRDNPPVSALSDILDRLDMLAEAEAMRFAPSFGRGASIPRRRGRRPCSATICCDAIDIARPGTFTEITTLTTKPCSDGCFWRIPIAW